MPTLLFRHPMPPPSGLRAAIHASHFADEAALARSLADAARFDADQLTRIAAWGGLLIGQVRRQPHPLDAFLHEYALASEEGVLLMCLAEGLIRIPDLATADRLIRETVGGARWEQHQGGADSLLVNASTWGLMLAGRMARLDAAPPAALLERLVARSGEGVVRNALRQAMHLLARQFVMGRSIDEALGRAGHDRRYRYSFDMLGEAAMSEADALRYAAAYAAAITALGAAGGAPELMARNGLSIKLSALHPRYEMAQRERVLAELLPRLTALLEQARAAGVPVTLDAEEAPRLELSLDIFEAVATVPALRDWPGLGLAVQAYQLRAPALLDWLAELAARRGAALAVRLVKGAYWDSEIKAAQQQGLPGYPVFTDKTHTDVCYLACARRLLAQPQHFYPQFATHNAHSVVAVRVLAGEVPFEYQRLHGMGEALYDAVGAQWALPCRVYAPVGGHRELLPYLVRRLLENGANSSFVNRVADSALPAEQLLADPATTVQERTWHSPLPAPRELYGAARANSLGTCLDDPAALTELHEALEQALAAPWQAGPPETAHPVTFPADRRLVIGAIGTADAETVTATLARAEAAWPAWAQRPLEERAELIRRAGDLLEQERHALAARIVMEGGRTLPDALAEVREAVDFCRYYAACAAQALGERTLPGPTGEDNRLHCEGRGVFLCISPWNFPVAIFTGQVVAALLAGNTVLAKPAHQTALCGALVIALLHEAGVPAEAVQLLPAAGDLIDEKLLAAPALAGVAFTGAVDTAHHLQLRLAQRRGPILPFIAETGGQNAMLVDSSALPEQAAADILRSAFNSAGQRCSALRVVFVQEEAAERLIEVLSGAMAELRVGDPRLLATDVGPLIDREALQKLERHLAELDGCGRLLARTPLPADCVHGAFLAPCLYEIDDLRLLQTEHFGPVLHLLRYRADQLDQVIDRINHLGYGLTLGVHSRIQALGRYVAARAEAGNVYINRDMIGAVVGSQPFGGRRLSGTGPKAGGPHYLLRFATEKTVTTNTAAIGGNAALLGRPQSQTPAAETQRRGEKN